MLSLRRTFITCEQSLTLTLLHSNMPSTPYSTKQYNKQNWRCTTRTYPTQPYSGFVILWSTKHACGRHTKSYLAPYLSLPIPDTTVAAYEVCVTFGAVGFVVHEGMRVEGMPNHTLLHTVPYTYLVPYTYPTLHIPDTTVATHEVCISLRVVGFVVHDGMRVEGIPNHTLYPTHTWYYSSHTRSLYYAWSCRVYDPQRRACGRRRRSRSSSCTSYSNILLPAARSSS